jgi:hypothetical protein
MIDGIKSKAGISHIFLNLKLNPLLISSKTPFFPSFKKVKKNAAIVGPKGATYTLILKTVSILQNK